MQKSPQFFNQSEQTLRHHSNKYVVQGFASELERPQHTLHILFLGFLVTLNNNIP